LRVYLGALCPRGFGASLNPGRGPLRGGGRTLEALRMRDRHRAPDLRALHKLERRQAARRADGNAPPPVATDVDVSGVARDEHERGLSSVDGYCDGETLRPTPNTRESSHLAYKDTPFGVCAPVCLGTTIRLIVERGAF
jgi:hypothetical protein